ncbi:hypothetical protein [Alkalispirochaeta americana]|uniref:hypothetical protein n=1 Tax=Alkalispirochaeta americana TaxID=159291 RepID=UPI00117B45C9|nr:hypothetical protein [Alkalispirochaeta americana]
MNDFFQDDTLQENRNLQENLRNETEQELFRLIETVQPGQRVRTSRLLQNRISCGKVRDILRTPGALVRAVKDSPGLSRLACTGVLPGLPRQELCLRRRFSPRERRGAVVDLNNLLWTLDYATLLRVLETLQAFGVHNLALVADATIYGLISREELASLADRVQEVEVVPSGTPADLRILERAEAGPALIVSSDMFRDWRKSSSWRRRTIWRLRVSLQRNPDAWRGFSFGDSEVELADPPRLQSEV